jgi:3-hydroxyisobutyrate dehydrogenase-like beta-hydroxyacid dehydrogenase
MGAAVAVQALAAGAEVGWCPRGRSADTVRRAGDAGLEPVDDLRALLDSSAVVISLCPPAVAEAVAEEVAACSYGGIFVEANAISPARTEKIAGLLGGEVLDGCVIGPPPGERGRARLYLSGSGEAAGRVAALFAGTFLEARVLDGPVGKASALKVAFASFNKAAQALAAVSYALAEHHGLRAELEAEAQLHGGFALAHPGTLPGSAARGWRWAPEMAEAAQTLAAAGLPADFAEAAAAVFARWAPVKDDFDTDLDTVLRLVSDPSNIK